MISESMAYAFDLIAMICKEEIENLENSDDENIRVDIDKIHLLASTFFDMDVERQYEDDLEELMYWRDEMLPQLREMAIEDDSEPAEVEERN